MADYRNLPDEDVEAMQNAAQVAERVVASLPPDVPEIWRATAYEILLGGILGDWVSNGTTEWDEEDEQILADMLRLSADTAMRQPLRDVAFRTLLKNVMHDWVENW